MFSKDRWKEILEVLSSNMLRTVATAFGVGWGIFILIILLAAGKGLENGIRLNFNGVATNTMFLWTETTSMAFEGLPEGRNFNFKLEDVELLRKNVPQLRIISPRNSLRRSENDNVIRGTESGQYRVFGDYPDIVEQRPIYTAKGRFFNYNDINQKRKVVVIGDGIRKDLYEKDEEVIGTYLKISGINFMVVGTYKEKTSNGGGENSEREIFMPFTTFSQAFNMSDNVGWMALTAKDGSSISNLTDKIISTVKQSRKVHPDDERAIGYFDLFEEYNRVESLFAALRFIAYFVGILVLISGIIGVSLSLIHISEPTRPY